MTQHPVSLHRLAAGAAALLVLLSGSLLAACGGGGDDVKKIAADDWVGRICGLASDFQSVEDKQTDAISRIDTSNPKNAKQDILTSLSRVDDGLATFRKGVEQAGKPDTDSGDLIRAAFLQRFDTDQKTSKDVTSKVKALDTSSQTKFETDLGNVFDGVPKDNFRSKLEDVANKKKDANDVIAKFDANGSCAATLFSDDNGGNAANNATPTQQAQPAATPTRSSVSNPTPSTSGAGKAVTVQQWTGNLCTAVTSWLNDIEKLDPTADVNKAKDAAGVKTIMVKFLSDATDRTTKMQRDLGVDYPQVKDGAAIHAAFVSGAGQAVALFAAATKDANALDTRDATKFGENLSNLGNAISDAGNDLEDVFSSIDTKYDTTEISRVAAGLPACKGIF